MNKSQKLFRYLWRINAVIILVAAGSIVFGVAVLLAGEFGARTARSREAEAGIPVAAAADSNAQLSLGRASLVKGTNIMRADLSLDRGGKGFSSGGYSETRNILFIEPDKKEGRWLLPDNDHIVSENSDITEGEDRSTKRVIATVALVKSATGSPETAGGRLLLFDPSGQKIIEVANDVRELHLASLSAGQLTVLFERNRHLVVATFDPASLAKRAEQEINVPQPK
jgi:hypothetical protein